MKNRVLFLSYNGLLEPILMSQAVPYLTALAKRDYEFILLTYEKKDDLDRTGKDRIREIRNGLRARGIDWRYMVYHKRPRLLATLFDLFVGAFYCLYLIPSKKVKIVHARGVTPGSMIMPVSKVCKVKLLFDMRGRLAEEMAAGGLWEEGSLSFRLVKMVERYLLKTADAIIVLTRKHFEYNKGLDCLRGRQVPMDVIPCCVDMGHFSRTEKDGGVRKELGLESKFVLMYPGKIGTFYLVDEMLAFYRAFSGKVPDSVFVVLTNDKPDILLDKLGRAGIGRDKIRVVQGVPFDSMPKYLAAADAGIFFINSRQKLGSSPIKMGEFLACGVPVIINPGVGDTQEIVIEGRVGVVVTSFTDEGYDSAIQELVRLKADEGALRARCRETARKYLSLEDGVDRYAKIYETLQNNAK